MREMFTVLTALEVSLHGGMIEEENTAVTATKESSGRNGGAVAR
jgi:hypothetical protein